MKKKQVAFLLAALMCITPVAESTAVMGAEFSSGEEAVEMQNTEEEAEAEETAEAWTSGAEVPDFNRGETSDSSISETSDFGTGEVPEVDGFTSEESETVTEAVGANQVKGSFAVAYITEEQYNNALQNEERPEVDMKTVEDTTFSNALNSIEGENTGYCFVSVQDLEDVADFVAPEGMTVLVENARVRSITPNGNIAFWDMVNPAEIEIKEGKGTTTFLNLDTESAIIKGTGSDDKVIFCGPHDWTALGGISGVENVYLRGNTHDLHIFGASEFFNIYNETDNIKNNSQDPNAYFIHIVNSKTAPVFHKTFDWGTGEFENENGDKWSSPYGIGIIYNTSDEINGWEDIPVPAGTQAVKYDMSDEDIIEMLPRLWVYSEDGTTQDMDGRIWNSDEDHAIELTEFQDCEGMSAQEIFEAYGKGEFPDGGGAWLGVVPGTAQAERYINAYQKKNNASGYYLMHMGAETEISETLTVPGSAKGLKIEGQNNYDESTDTDNFVPTSISSVNVPAGKKLSLDRILVKANTLTFTGTGEVELLNARLNANVTADKITFTDAVVKSLDCKELTAREGGRLIVSEYLSFDKAVFHPDLVVYGQPGAYLKFGEIDSTEFTEESSVQIFLGNDGKQTANLYVGGALKLGEYTIEETYSRNLLIGQFDAKEAEATGVPVAQDCFSPAYSYDWKDIEDNGWWEHIKMYQGEEIKLAEINSSLSEDDSIKKLAFRSRISVNGDEKRIVVRPRYLYLDHFKGLSDGIEGNKRYVFYVDWWSNEDEVKTVEIPAYYEVVGESQKSIASAQISPITTQVYAGKALEPSVTVTLNGKKLKAGTDYTVSYANNTKAGSTASVIITGKGNYVGTAIRNFEIAEIPAKGNIYTSGSLKYRVTKSAYKNGTVSVYAPSRKTLTSASVPATVKINGYVFRVTSIGNKAFNGCEKLKKVTIGSKVTTIGKQAFNGCKALTSITVNSKVLKTVGSSAFQGISAKAAIKVPAAKLSAYQKLLKGKGQKSSVKITK